MSSLVILSDTHSLHSHVSVPSGDVLIHCGDFSASGDVHDTVEFLKWFESQLHDAKVLVAGNHDKLSDQEPTLFRSLLAEHAPSVTYLQDSGVWIGGLYVYGSPVTPTFFDWYHMRDRGEAIRKHWDAIPAYTNVLVTHGPPLGFGDWSPYDKIHAGDADLLDAIKRVKPSVACHGHFHHSQCINELAHEDGTKTILVNATICNEQYRPVNKSVVIDL